MATADEALGKVNEILYEYMESKSLGGEAAKDAILGIEKAINAQDEFLTELLVARMGINAMVHRNPVQVVDLGEGGQDGEWMMSDVTMNHDIRWREKGGHVQIFCSTCETAARERETGA